MGINMFLKLTAGQLRRLVDGVPPELLLCVDSDFLFYVCLDSDGVDITPAMCYRHDCGR